MPASKGGRRQPRMPNLNLSRQQLRQSKSQADPTSPPHTPTKSPHKARKTQPVFGQASRPGPAHPRIQPVGNGHQFSYQPFIGPEQLSPRSPSLSEAADDSDEDESSSGEAQHRPDPIKAPSPLVASDAQSSSEEQSDSDEASEGDDDSDADDDSDEEDDDEEEMEDQIEAPQLGTDARKPPSPPTGKAVYMEDDDDEEDDEEGEEEEEEDDDDDDDNEEDDDGDDEFEDRDDDDERDEDGPIMESPVYAAVATTTTTVCDFVLEDMDPMDSDNGLSVLDPYEIESNLSRSSSKHRDNKAPKFQHRDLPIRMMQDMRNLHCSNEASDEEGEQDTEEAAFYKWQQQMRRRRLSISSSITGKRTFSERSESDDSDDAGLDVNEVGSSARRMRKRMHRGSLLFQDPPEPRIDECEEPNSSEDEYVNTQNFGMELPYWPIENWAREINEMEDSQ
ncbi:hypothetical protein IF1G_09284 [Cordyceps javanica]|uniref:Uncharacterized protein n=1 Tax=Cordyceps javanica TaxID=43265 RepID=A0A545URW3_9HYPO|nr:hypothetical protein IF1G_09284 [Cordyceps javanica]TQW04001.1 hypothetical protein IF2G_08315 [Cordyceps javanica]